jgi:hypothetical protein
MFISPKKMETSIPVAIRPDVIVRFIGLPRDLTRQEAAKIANVVKGYAEGAANRLNQQSGKT